MRALRVPINLLILLHLIKVSGDPDEAPQWEVNWVMTAEVFSYLMYASLSCNILI